MMPHGKSVRIDPNDPEGVGICDYSSRPFPRGELVRQMKYSGDRVIWTGFMVAKRYMDPLDPGDKPKKGGSDPLPIEDARHDDGGDGLGSFLVLTTGEGNTWATDTGERVGRATVTLLWQ